MRGARAVVLRGILAVAFLPGCKRTTSVSLDTTPSPEASARSAAPVPSASASPAEPSTTEDRGRAILARWSEALNSGDTGALRKLYAPSVLYYGTKLDGPSCVERVAAALAKSPGYHQDVEVEKVADDVPFPLSTTVFFAKRNAGRKYDAYLVVDTATSTIAEESDRTTDANLVKRAACFSYDSPVTLQGKLSGAWHATGHAPERGVFLDLDKSVCVIDLTPADVGASDFSGPVQPPRIDTMAVHVLTDDLRGAAPAALEGKRVTVTGHFEGTAMRDFTNLHIRADTLAAR
jgi:hypothetical protein